MIFGKLLLGGFGISMSNMSWVQTILSFQRILDMARYMEKWAEKVSFAPLLLRWFADWILSIIKMVILM